MLDVGFRVLDLVFTVCMVLVKMPQVDFQMILYVVHLLT